MRRLPIRLCLIFLFISVFLAFPFTSFAQEESTPEPAEPQVEGPTVVIVGGEEAAPEAEIQEPDAKAPVEKGVELDKLDSATAETTSTTEPPPETEPDDENQSQVAPIVVENSTFTGAATYTIPIEVPPGRNGLTPELKLVYNSYLNNSWVGVSWSLDMGTIQRSTKHGLDYSANDFVYVKNGTHQELEPRDDWGANFYGHKIEENYYKYYFNSLTGGWEVYRKNGLIYFYGSTSDSRQENEKGVFKWYLDFIQDTNGNYIELTYIVDLGTVYLNRIDYSGNTQTDLLDNNSILFHLEDRTDAEVSYNSYASTVLAKRLKSIEVRSGDSTVRAYSADYNMSLGTQRSLLTRIKEHGSDVTLDSFGAVTGGAALPPTEIEYIESSESDFLTACKGEADEVCGTDNRDYMWHANTRFISGDYNGDGLTDIFVVSGYSGDKRRRLHLSTGTTFTSTCMGSGDEVCGTDNRDYMRHVNTRFISGDYNGDGLTDIFIVSGDSSDKRRRLHLSTGTTFTTACKGDADGACGTDSESYMRHANTRFISGDYNGDGLTDVFIVSGRSDFPRRRLHLSAVTGFTTACVGEEDGACGTDSESYMQNKNTRFISGDYNGDGLTDIFIVSGESDFPIRRLHLSTGAGFTTACKGEEDGACGTDSESYMQNKNTRFISGDYNGDGLTDILIVSGESAFPIRRLHLSTGTGFTTACEGEVDGACGTDSESYMRHANTRFVTGDYNGDGMTDIFVVSGDPDFTKRTLRLSTGTGFTTACQGGADEACGTDKRTYMWHANTRFISGDYNGDGLSDIFIISGTSIDPRRRLHLSVYKKEFAENIVDRFGLRFDVDFSDSSNYQNTLLPFIVHPVSKITLDDGLGNTSEYNYDYSGGLYDFATREFRGFETVTRTNPDGTISQTKYHQDEFRKGRVEEEGLWAAGADLASDTPLVKTSNTWEPEYLNAPDNTQAFVKLSQQRTDYHDATSVFNQQDFVYDSVNGNLLSVTASGTGAESVTTDYAYANYGDWIWRRTQETLTGETSGKVRENTFEYETGTGNLLVREDWLDTGPNPRTTFQYDAYGNVTHTKNPRGHTTIVEYDTETATFPVKITYPATTSFDDVAVMTSTESVIQVDHVVEMAWDARHGKKLWEKDENGNIIYYSHDPFGRISQTDFPDGGQTTVEYVDNVVPRYLITRVKETATGPTIDRYRYLDGLNREVQTVAFGEGGKRIITKTFYDDMGRLFRTEGPFFATGSDYPQTPPVEYPWQETLYDDRGRPLSITSAHGQHGTITATLAYEGFATTFTDPDGSRKIEEKDYLGRITRVTENNDTEQYHTDYAYNAAGDLKSVTDHLNNVTTVTWDTLGRKTAMDDPNMGASSYTYDANGNLLTQTDALSQTVTFEYDELNRVITKSYSTSDSPVYYVYDETDNPSGNGIGRLSGVVKGDVYTVYAAYDDMGRLLAEFKMIVGSDEEYFTEYQYDLSGKLIRTTHPDGTYVDNAFYPGTGLLHTVTGSTGTVYSTHSQYEPTGKMGVVDHGNGTRTTYTYDALSTKLTRIVTEDDIGTLLQDRAYHYSPAGDIEQIADAANGVTYTYTYDDLHRLTSETNTGPDGPIFYEYNAIGNIVSKTVGADTFDYTYDPAHPHAVSQVTVNGTPYAFTYDANGNMTSGKDLTDPANPANRTLIWNADNMAISVTRDGVTNTFAYDGTGKRARKQLDNGTKTFYVSDGYEEIAGEATTYIFAGNLRIAKVTTGAVSYFHKDHLGSSTVMTDHTGATVETAEYRPFGTMRSHTGAEVSNYKFTDQELDTESGLYNYDARLYDPLIGRFISADSIVPKPFGSQSLNRYSYVFNNPMIYIDPTGHIGGNACGGCHGDWDSNYGWDNNSWRVATAVGTGFAGSLATPFGFTAVSLIGISNIQDKLEEDYEKERDPSYPDPDNYPSAPPTDLDEFNPTVEPENTSIDVNGNKGNDNPVDSDRSNDGRDKDSSGSRQGTGIGGDYDGRAPGDVGREY